MRQSHLLLAAVVKTDRPWPFGARLVAPLLLFIALAVPVHGTVYYVSPAGNDAKRR